MRHTWRELYGLAREARSPNVPPSIRANAAFALGAYMVGLYINWGRSYRSGRPLHPLHQALNDVLGEDVEEIVRSNTVQG